MFITKLCIHNTTTKLYQLILQNIDTAKLVYSEYKGKKKLLSNCNSLNFHSEFVRNLMANLLYNIELKVLKTILAPFAEDFDITFSFSYRNFAKT